MAPFNNEPKYQKISAVVFEFEVLSVTDKRTKLSKNEDDFKIENLIYGTDFIYGNLNLSATLALTLWFQPLPTYLQQKL